MNTDRYGIVLDKNLFEMERLVNSFIAKGWLPQGGIYITEHGFYQAMILPSKDSTINGMLGVKVEN